MTSDLVSCFYNTMEFIKNNKQISYETEKLIISTRVYKEDFIARHSISDADAEIIVEANTTFASAKKYIFNGKVAVLNFANPHNPGGGVVNGAMAQEECLCRSSNLYLSLASKEAQEQYYNYNRKLAGYYFSNRIVYSPEVIVFKTDDVIPQLMPSEQWFHVDVITCAAPFADRLKYVNRKVLLEVFLNRIDKIFQVAMDNGVEVLVLGAFGCGAFGNPPEIVAEAFHKICERYKHNFHKIVFAIKSTVDDDPWSVCPNIEAFEYEFLGISEEMSKGRMLGGIPVAYAFGDAIIPDGTVRKEGLEFLEYYEWKQNNPYVGKQFSILGDSISTLEGYNPRNYNIFFDEMKCQQAEIFSPTNTWWGKIIDFYGGELLVNNSWSGSRVAKLPGKDRLFPSSCSNERTGKLHFHIADNKEVLPDVIIIYMGTNDWAFGTPLQDNGNNPLYSFECAYNHMLNSIHSNYPNAEIWCSSLMTTYMSKNSKFVFPYAPSGKHIEMYNALIEKAVVKLSAEGAKVRYLDLYKYNIPYDSIDGSHPNRKGMEIIASLMVMETADKEGKAFLSLEKELKKNESTLERKEEKNMNNTDIGNEYERDINDIRNQSAYIQPQQDYNNIGRQKPQANKGKKWIKIFLCIVVAVVVSAAVKLVVKNITKDVLNPKYEQGVIKDNTYRSEFLGLKFVCPDDCEMKNELLDEDAEKILGLDDNKSYQEGKQATVTEVSVSDGLGNSNFNILIQKGRIGSIEKYKDEIESALEEAYSDMITSVEIQDVEKDTLAGAEYDVIGMTSTMFGVQLEQKQYIREIGKYTVIITFTGDVDKYKDCFSEL